MSWTNIRQAIAVTSLAALVLLPGSARSQEHPSEHPSGSKPAEKASLTMAELARAIEDYVTSDARMKGGYFLVYDPIAKAPLALTLERVHEDRLSSLGDGVYFACADFKASDGTTYDVDVFMKSQDNELRPTDVHIHKVAEKPRYTWKEEGGVWMRQDVK